MSYKGLIAAAAMAAALSANLEPEMVERKITSCEKSPQSKKTQKRRKKNKAARKARKRNR